MESRQVSSRHGRRYKTIKRQEQLAELKEQLQAAYIKVAVLLTLADIQHVILATDNGQFGCVPCEYERRRAGAEMRAWEEKNSAMLDRWLWWSGHVLMKTVPKGDPQHMAGPWPTDSQCKH
mmetsp:Transcript_28905/g.74271  ORF Transcript_28905/g.74271 Transcript_28905/m.74271 type:complete len:121 (+) Transcript_28905:266-628(+)